MGKTFTGTRVRRMKITRIEFVTEGDGPQRVYNTSQTPEVGVEYDVTANGWVVGKSARVVMDEDGGWRWYPVASSYSSSYYFKELPWIIEVD
jgi:hypothetical protein